MGNELEEVRRYINCLSRSPSAGKEGKLSLVESPVTYPFLRTSQINVDLNGHWLEIELIQDGFDCPRCRLPRLQTVGRAISKTMIKLCSQLVR